MVSSALVTSAHGRASAGGGHRGLGARVAGTDHEHVEDGQLAVVALRLRHGAARRCLTLARILAAGGGLGDGAAPQQAVPAAGDAPALAKPGQHTIEEQRGDAQRGVIAVGAAIAAWQDEEKRDRGHDESEDDESSEDHDEQGGV
jgi:hypothetical protein